MRKLYWISNAVWVASALVHADDISVGFPGYGGNGCPQGSASATLSPDAKQLSILFDSYVVEANASKRIDRKSCNLAIPIHVPNGISVSILRVDYRGFNGLPAGASSTLTAEYFLADRQGPRFTRDFWGAQDRDYYESNSLAAVGVVWTPCGRDTNLRINSSIRVRTNAAGQQAMSTVDSVDLSAGLVYHLQFRRCTI